MNEEVANPYNSNKEWQHAQEEEFKSSDTLFVPSRTKTVISDPREPISSEANQDDEDLFHKKRYDELKRHHDSTIRDLRQELEQLKAENQAAKTPSYVPPKSPEEIEKFKESSPELYAVLESQIYNQTKDTAERVKALDEREKKIAKQEAVATIRRIHPDFDEIKVDDKFHDWANAQDIETQKAIYENPYNGELAAKVISAYKYETGIVTSSEKNDVDQSKEPEVDAAMLLPTRNSGANTTPEKKIWRESEIAKMTMRQYDRYEAEILAAEEEGRIVKG